ncbi:MAG: sulfatase, partial [Akkermansiaceae bacterium]|nr:sulfatase [Akkermansiaceae bacterium]
MRIQTIVPALLLVPVLALAAPETGREARPNIVFLLTDDQCTSSVGCYGNAEVKTPHMDSLARDGIAFDNHYDTTAICMASRANIMTGKFEFRNGCNFEHGALVKEHWMQSYPILLRKAGYLTAIAGKIGLEVTETPGKKGELPEGDFDKWGAGPGQTSYATKKNKSMAAYAKEYPHSSRSYGAFGRDFIAEAATSGKPFCLSISFKAPHMPATPDPLDDAVYAGKTFTRPKNYGRENGLHFSEQSRQGRQYARFFEWGYADRYDKVMATYYQQVYAVDVAIGMIREALEEHGVAGNTVVIFTSDNGFLCGSHGYGSKVLPYEEASRVPLIIYDPRHANSGKRLRSGALTGNVDMAPTIMELAGIDLPGGMDGRSLLPLYDDPKAETHQWLPLINVWGPREVHSLGVVTKDLKYIYWPWAEGEFEAAEELYHLGEDPLELTNQAASASYAGALEKMRARYDRLVA